MRKAYDRIARETEDGDARDTAECCDCGETRCVGMRVARPVSVIRVRRRLRECLVLKC
jgi:hypothetical protein